MSVPVQHKINAAQFDYEYMGKSVEDIAAAYDFPLPTMSVACASWERKIAPTELPDTKDMQLFADQLEKITRSKLAIVSLFRQIDNQPLYASIEKAILGKILDLTDRLDAMDDRAANKLLSLAKTVESIQARNPIDLAESFKDALAGSSGQGGITVNIANQIQ